MRRAPLVRLTLLLAAAGPARADNKAYDRCLDRSGGVAIDMKECGAAEMERQ